MEFQPIQTQEELDRIIGERLKRERQSVAKQYEDYEEVKVKKQELEQKIIELQTMIEEQGKRIGTEQETSKKLQQDLDAKTLEHLKVRIAIENGIPYELATRLTGANEEELLKDAEILRSFVQSERSNVPQPLKSTETGLDEISSEYQSLISKLNY